MKFKQNEGPQNNCSEKEAFRKSKENETSPLDYLLSDEEFDTAICKLKANKASSRHRQYSKRSMESRRTSPLAQLALRARFTIVGICSPKLRKAEAVRKAKKLRLFCGLPRVMPERNAASG